MGKNPASGKGHGSAVRDRSQEQNPVNERPAKRGGKRPVRVILFPTEPSTIGNDKIDRAIDAVIARRKA